MRHPWFLLAVMALGLVFATTVEAQVNPNYRVEASDASGTVGGTADMEFSLTIATDIAGWSWSACHTDNVSLGSDEDILPSSTVDDANILVDIINVEDNGYSVAVILEVDPQDLVAAGEDILMYTVTYDLDTEGAGLVTFCEDIGDGAPTLAEEDATGVEPASFAGTITVDGDAAFKFLLADQEVPYDPDLPTGVSFTTTVSILEDDDNVGFPQNTQGFKMGVAHDSSVLSVTDVELGNSELDDMDDGAGPIYFGANLNPSQSDGFTVGCVFSFLNDEFMVFDDAKTVVDVTYDVSSTPLDGNVGGLQTTLNFDETIASPAVVNAIVVDSVESEDVATYDSIITMKNTAGTFFKRGDVDGNGNVGALLDAQFGLDWVFNDGDAPPCLDAMDVNDDGILSALVDMLSLLWWAFGDGVAPASPGTVTCGIDTSDDTLTCLVQATACD